VGTTTTSVLMLMHRNDNANTSQEGAHLRKVLGGDVERLSRSPRRYPDPVKGVHAVLEPVPQLDVDIANLRIVST
jgi:hypothetical protein